MITPLNIINTYQFILDKLIQENRILNEDNRRLIAESFDLSVKLANERIVNIFNNISD